MILFFIGILIFGIAYVLPSNPNYSAARLNRSLKIGGIGVAVVGLLLSSIKQIDAGEVGVQKLFGEVQDKVLESGLNIVNPFMRVTPVNVRTQNYTMSGVHDEGSSQGDDAIRILSSDGLELVIDLTVLYHVNKFHKKRRISTEN